MQNTGKFRISSSFNLHTENHVSILDNVVCGIEMMESVGFDAADFTAKMLNRIDDNYSILMNQIVDFTSSRKIHFELCHLPFDPKIATDHDRIPEFNARMHRAIDAAKILGVSYAVMHPNTTTVLGELFNRTESYDSVMRHISPFVEHANKIGLNTVIENLPVVRSNYSTHRYSQDPDEICEIADSLGIGICYDLGHGNIAGYKQSDYMRYLGARIKVIHVNDNLGSNDTHLPPYSGNIDWIDAVNGLSEIGFEGLFNYEIATAGVPDDKRADFAGELVNIAHRLLK